MQQTEHYQLNLIETSDPFSPEPLNKNTETVDAALATIPKFACGAYNGNGAANRSIELPFTPKMVYVINSNGATYYNNSGGIQNGGVALKGTPLSSNHGVLVEIVTGGFRVSFRHSYATVNSDGIAYRYFALG